MNEKKNAILSLSYEKAYVASSPHQLNITKKELQNKNILFLPPVLFRALAFQPGTWNPCIIGSIKNLKRRQYTFTCPLLNCSIQIQPYLNTTLPETNNNTEQDRLLSWLPHLYGNSDSSNHPPGSESDTSLQKPHTYQNDPSFTNHSNISPHNTIVANTPFWVSPSLALRMVSFLVSLVQPSSNSYDCEADQCISTLLTLASQSYLFLSPHIYRSYSDVHRPLPLKRTKTQTPTILLTQPPSLCPTSTTPQTLDNAAGLGVMETIMEETQYITQFDSLVDQFVHEVRSLEREVLDNMQVNITIDDVTISMPIPDIPSRISHVGNVSTELLDDLLLRTQHLDPLLSDIMGEGQSLADLQVVLNGSLVLHGGQWWRGESLHGIEEKVKKDTSDMERRVTRKQQAQRRREQKRFRKLRKSFARDSYVSEDEVKEEALRSNKGNTTNIRTNTRRTKPVTNDGGDDGDVDRGGDQNLNRYSGIGDDSQVDSETVNEDVSEGEDVSDEYSDASNTNSEEEDEQSDMDDSYSHSQPDSLEAEEYSKDSEDDEDEEPQGPIRIVDRSKFEARIDNPVPPSLTHSQCSASCRTCHRQGLISLPSSSPSSEHSNNTLNILNTHIAIHALSTTHLLPLLDHLASTQLAVGEVDSLPSLKPAPTRYIWPDLQRDGEEVRALVPPPARPPTMTEASTALAREIIAKSQQKNNASDPVDSKSDTLPIPPRFLNTYKLNQRKISLNNNSTSHSHPFVPQDVLFTVASHWAAAVKKDFAGHDSLVDQLCHRILLNSLPSSSSDASLSPPPSHSPDSAKIVTLLIQGPSGTGKTHLARLLAAHAPGPHMIVSAADLTSSTRGEAGEKLSELARICVPEGSQCVRRVGASQDLFDVEGGCVGMLVVDDADTLTPNEDEDGDGSRYPSNEYDLLETLALLVKRKHLTKHLSSPHSSLPHSGPASSSTFSNHYRIPPLLLLVLTSSNPTRIHSWLTEEDSIDLRVNLSTLRPDQRTQLMQMVSHRLPLSLSSPHSIPSFLDSISARLHGFTAADITRLVTDVSLAALQRSFNVAAADLHPRLLQLINYKQLQILPRDWVTVLSRGISPSALHTSGLGLNITDPSDWEELLSFEPSDRSLLPIEDPSYKIDASLTYRDSAPIKHRPTNTNSSSHLSPAAFDQLGGLHYPKAVLTRYLVEPLQAIVKGESASLPSGVLLSGPPGSGKTSLSLALAKAAQLPILTANAASLVNKLVGGGEKAIHALFETARASAPCILLLDNIEAIAGRDVYAEQRRIELDDMQRALNQNVQVDKQSNQSMLSPSRPRSTLTFDKSGGYDHDRHLKKRDVMNVRFIEHTELIPINPTRLVTTLLQEIDNLQAPIKPTIQCSSPHSGLESTDQTDKQTQFVENYGRVIVVATSREPHSLPPQLTRAGRLGLHVCLHIPDFEDRWDILAALTSRMPLAVTGCREEPVDLQFTCVRMLLCYIAYIMDEATAADIKAVLTVAAMTAIREIKHLQDQQASQTGENDSDVQKDVSILPHDLLHALKSYGYLQADQIIDTSAMNKVGRLFVGETELFGSGVDSDKQTNVNLSIDTDSLAYRYYSLLAQDSDSETESEESEDDNIIEDKMTRLQRLRNRR